MRIDPAIAALRSDRAPQCQAQTAMDAVCRTWRTASGAQAAVLDLERYGRGADIADCPALAGLIADPLVAGPLIGDLVEALCAAMRANPIAHPPFRHGFDGSAATLLLARSGRAQLLLQAREPGTFSYTTANFSDAERSEIVLAGSARAQILRIVGRSEDRVEFKEGQLDLLPDITLAMDLRKESLTVTSVDTRLVTLRLMRNRANPQPSLEYERAGGRLIHRSAGDLVTSHRETMVALLGRMGRRDAAPVLADVARAEGDDSLRWQALRECLALDTATGFATLSQLARDPHDPLSADAGALRAQLVEAHPQLLAWENSQCPA